MSKRLLLGTVLVLAAVGDPTVASGGGNKSTGTMHDAYNATTAEGQHYVAIPGQNVPIGSAAAPSASRRAARIVVNLRRDVE
jgi:hypothetical protein